MNEFFDNKYLIINECFIWQGYTDKDGYGRTSYKGKMWLTHRLSYLLNIGNIQDGLYVLHTCDNPSCINPKHLFLGTQKDNMQDMFNKGRNSDRTKENNGRARLKTEQITEIRNLYATGNYTYQELCGMFNVANSTIQHIVQKRNWK